MSTESPEELYRRENAKRGYPMRPLASRGGAREVKCPACKAIRPIVRRLAKKTGARSKMECSECHYKWNSMAKAFQPGRSIYAHELWA